jgi:EmrB/QacA subfamily drug resistance transporter
MTGGSFMESDGTGISLEPRGRSAAAEADPRRWFALVAIAAAQFMVVLDIAIVNVALPSIGKDLKFAQQDLQWVISAYAIVFGGFLLLGGRLADLWGRRRMFMAGVILFSICSLLCGLAWSESSLIAFRALQGLGGALLSPAALSILTTTFAEGRERNVALGVWGAVAGSGAAAGTLLGGVLTSGLGWSWIFFVNVPLGVAVVALAPWLLRASRLEGERGSDFAGAISVTAGLMLLVYAMTEAATRGWGTGRTVGLLVAAGVLLVGFLAIELRTRMPIMPLRIFRLRTLSAANLVGVLVGAALFSQFFLLSLYMQQILGFSALRTGVAYVASTLTIILFSGIAQGLVTRYGVKPILTVGLVLAGGSIGAFYTRLPVDGTYAGDLLVPFLIGGIGLGLTFVPMSIAALTAVTPRDAGLASGLINTSPQIGGAIGLAVASTLATTFASRYVANNPGMSPLSPEAVMSGFHVAFAVQAALTLLAAVVAALLIERRSSQAVIEPGAQAIAVARE